MPKENEITLSLYLESTRLDKHGAKHLTFEVSTKQSIATAKLELMGRDLIEHLPVLLIGKFTIAILRKDCQNARQTKRIKTLR